MLRSFGWGFTLLYKQLKTDSKSFIFAVCHNCLAYNLSNVFSKFSSVDYIVKKSLQEIMRRHICYNGTISKRANVKQLFCKRQSGGGVGLIEFGMGKT